MSEPRKLLWPIIAVIAVAVSFAAGRWSGSLAQSLKGESAYPWELHRKIGSVDIGCETLSGTPGTGKFFVRPLDDGATLVVASLDGSRKMVTAFALNTAGQVASDSWPLECK